MSRDITPRQLFMMDRDLVVKKGSPSMAEIKMTYWLSSDEEKQYLSDLASRVDRLFRDFDPYGYMDDVEDEEENVKMIQKDIYSCGETLDGMIETVEEIAQDDELKEEALKIAEELKAVIKKHRGWNDEARKEYPNLSFLLGSFETEIYDTIEKESAKELIYKRADNILGRIMECDKGIVFDDEMIQENLETLSEISYKGSFTVLPEIITAVKEWYDPKDFYYSEDNNETFVGKLNKFAEDLEDKVRDKTHKRNNNLDR